MILTATSELCSVEEMYESGEVYPSRPLVRPCVQLKGKQDKTVLCTKNYRNNVTHSSEIFTVQCACSSPRLLGIIVIDSNEGATTALNSILTRFQTFPGAVYYNNACNLTK